MRKIGRFLVSVKDGLREQINKENRKKELDEKERRRGTEANSTFQVYDRISGSVPSRFIETSMAVEDIRRSFVVDFSQTVRFRNASRFVKYDRVTTFLRAFIVRY